MPNIRELAAQLGVSAATVSLAMNHKKGVSAKLAQKIRERAFEIGYHKGLKQLNKGACFTVRILQIIKHGHILGAHHQSFIDGYIMGMMKYAMQCGQLDYNVQLEVQTLRWEQALQSNWKHEIEPEARRSKEAKQAAKTRTKQSQSQHGFIVIATELEADEIELLANKIRRPIVFIDAIYDQLPYDFIDMNNTDVVYEILAHLVAQSCQTVSFVGSKQNTPNFYQREIAVEAACDKYNIDLKRRYSIDPYDDPDALEMQSLLSQTPITEFPEALICANDYIAYNCIKALHRLNYRIPEDVAIIGFDNLPASPLFQPPLSSVEIPKQEIGSLAVARLIAKLGNNSSPTALELDANILREAAAKQNLSCRFIPRASSTKSKPAK